MRREYDDGYFRTAQDTKLAGFLEETGTALREGDLLFDFLLQFNIWVICFGHPDVETVLDHYLTGNHAFSNSSTSQNQLSNYVNVPTGFMNRQYVEVQMELEREKKRLAEIEEEVKRKKKENNNGEYLWWEEPLDENMELDEMETT